MDGTYITLAWSFFAFIVGAATGLYLALKLTRATPTRPTATLRQFQWARSDINIAPPTTKNTQVRLTSDWQDAGIVEGRAFTFHIKANGIERDVTFNSRLLLKFFKSGDDGPTRAGYHGDHSDYSKLLATAKAYGWTYPDGRRWLWSLFLSTRERRLNVLTAWLARGNDPTP